MFITYLIVSTLLGIWISFIWSSNGAMNCAIKTLFSVWTLWSMATLFSVIWPLIQSGQIKLI